MVNKPLQWSQSKKHLNFATKQKQIIAFWVVVMPTLGTIVAMFWSLLYGVKIVGIEICLGMYAVTSLAITVGCNHLFTHLNFQNFQHYKAIEVLMGCYLFYSCSGINFILGSDSSFSSFNH